MNLKKHTTSLEISLALRDAGYPQGVSVFYWVDDGEGELHDWTVVKEGWTQMKKIDAPLASELLERMPPYFIRSGHLYTLIVLPKETAGGYCARYIRNRFNTHMGGFGHAKTLPDALAKLWLHLKKEGLLK